MRPGSGSNPPPPRRTRRPFPAYAYRPGRNPHPRRPGGHSHGDPGPSARGWDPERWWLSDTYGFALDLLEAGYAWESHEFLEVLWKAAGPGSAEGRLLQALILLAGAQLKLAIGQPRGASRLLARALSRIEGLGDAEILGIGIPGLTALLRRLAASGARDPVRLPSRWPREH